MPEGVAVSLVRYFYKAEDVKATHSIVFAGPVEGLIELRQIRSDEKYEAFYDDLNVLDAKVVANSAGQSLFIFNLIMMIKAFAELMQNFKSVETYVAFH